MSDAIAWQIPEPLPPASTDMTGKVALVTGAASGLGRETARRLAAVGAKLWLVDVNSDGLAEIFALLPPGAVTETRALSLTDPEACRQTVTDAVARFGRLDALCNVAGVIFLANTSDMPFDLYQGTRAVNLSAPFLLSQAAISVRCDATACWPSGTRRTDQGFERPQPRLGGLGAVAGI